MMSEAITTLNQTLYRHRYCAQPANDNLSIDGIHWPGIWGRGLAALALLFIICLPLMAYIIK